MEEHKQIPVNELAALLDASKETIRRDLTVLEERDLLRKVHGSAVCIQVATEDDFSKRINEQRLEKQRIAERAAKLFRPGDSLLIDGGTTTAIFATELGKLEGLIVITNSIMVASQIKTGSGLNQVILLGGEYMEEIQETVGPMAIEQISACNVDHTVLTIGAVDQEQGFFDYNFEETAIARAMIKQGRSVTVLADHTKLGRPGMVQVCELDKPSKLITDRQPPQEFALKLISAGVELIIA